MRPVKGFGLLVAFSMALGMMATTPGIAAASTYSRDGGSPASCPTPYTVLNSATISAGTHGGYIKVEMVYCAAWSVVWTRAYNYTNGTAWLATGIVRTENGSVANRYDYTNGSCPSFCIDSLTNGTRSYGAQLYWPPLLNVVDFTSTAYYCTSNSPSACRTAISTAPLVGAKIANLASRNLNAGPCSTNSRGYRGFDSPSGTSSCPGGQPAWGWCDEFAGWVWRAADSRVDISGLVNNTGPGAFRTAGTTSSTPHVGDAAVMIDQYGMDAHVGIVTAIDGSRVTIVSGNERGNTNVVAQDYWTPGGALVDGAYTVSVYVTPPQH